MPVQQVALSEVELFGASDEVLERAIGLQAAGTGGMSFVPMTYAPVRL